MAASCAPISIKLVPLGFGISARYWLNLYNPHALSEANPMSMPIIRDTTTAADAMPCCEPGTVRRVADVNGPITRPSPRPARIRSVSNAGSVNSTRSWRAESTSTVQWDTSQ